MLEDFDLPGGDILDTLAKLRLSEERFATVIDHLQEGLVIGGSGEELIHWNPAALAMHGYASLDECRLKLPQLLSTFRLHYPQGPEQVPLAQWPMARVWAGEILKGAEYRVCRLDQGWERVFRYSGELLRSPSGEDLAYLSITDVTEHHRAAAEREALIAQLQEALSQVKKLSGLLPICAACKKIRDTHTDEWQSVDTYITKHSEATFTHGLCPECMKSYFP